MKRIFGTLLFVLAAHPAFAFDLTVVSYNVESDSDTDPAKVVQDLQRIPASHIWGLAEVDTGDLETYRMAIGPGFELIAGNTGFISSRADDRHVVPWPRADWRRLWRWYTRILAVIREGI